MHNNQHQHQHQLFEGLEQGDLVRLVHHKLHVDEFKSKMGDDADIIVLSFKVDGKEPATDLMNFIERGYEWVLDSDVSAGELDDGEYLVFVELDRTPRAPAHIIKLIEDILNLTDQKMDEWRFQYRKNSAEFDMTEENLKSQIPVTADQYLARFGDEEEIDPEELDKEAEADLTAMQEAARVPIVKKAPVNDFTQSLRAAAGII